MENIIVFIIVIIAAGYIAGRFIVKIKRGNSCDCQSCPNECGERSNGE